MIYEISHVEAASVLKALRFLCSDCEKIKNIFFINNKMQDLISGLTFRPLFTSSQKTFKVSFDIFFDDEVKHRNRKKKLFCCRHNQTTRNIMIVVINW